MKNSHLPLLAGRQDTSFKLAAALLLVVVTVAAYLPAVKCGYIWDDESYVQNNPTLHSAAGLKQIWFKLRATPQYYPMVHTTYWLEYHLWKLNPAGFHVVNILLHAAGAVLLWRILTGLGLPGAWLAAAVFALHPVHVESVAWITERKNVLSGVFYLASALAYLRYARLIGGELGQSTSRKFYIASLVLFLLALFSKTVVCTLPAVLLLIIWYKRGHFDFKHLRLLTPFFVIGISLGLLTAWMEKHDVGAIGTEWSLSIIERCLVAGRVVCFYVGKLFWPTQLTFNYPRWQINAGALWQYLFPAVVAAGIAGLWLARRRIGRAPLTAVLFFLITLLPALGFFDVYPMRYSFVADHFQYLASIGPIAMAVALGCLVAARLGRRAKNIAAAIALLILITLGALTWRQCPIYKDLETLWRDTLKKNPNSWMVNNNLGIVLESQGRLDEAISHYRQALRLVPDHPESHNNIAGVLLNQGKLDQALDHFRRAVQLRPELAGAHGSIGYILALQGRLDEAVTYYVEALRLNPSLADVHGNLGYVLMQQGRLDEAITHFVKALEIKPDLAEAHSNFGHTLLRQGRFEQAAGRFAEAVRIKPDFADAHSGLGRVLALLGKSDKAAIHLKKAIQLNPNIASAHYILAGILTDTGRTGEAIIHFREALRLRPDWVDAINSLAWIFATAQEAGLRSPEQAIQLAQRACELTGYQDPRLLATLAAAYAADGRFADAVTTAEKALELAGSSQDEQLTGQIQSQLLLYKESRPYEE